MASQVHLIAQEQVTLEDEPLYMEVLPPTQRQELPGNSSMHLAKVTTDIEEENIYDNDDCFPPEFIKRMKQQSAYNPYATIEEVMEELPSLHYQRPTFNVDDNHIYAEVDHSQLLCLPPAFKHRDSVLIDALDLTPPMRVRSSGISKQQATKAKLSIRLKKQNSLAANDDELTKDDKTQVTPQDNLSKPVHNMEAFEKMLEAYGTPKTYKAAVKIKSDVKSYKKQFTRSSTDYLKH